SRDPGVSGWWVQELVGQVSLRWADVRASEGGVARVAGVAGRPLMRTDFVVVADLDPGTDGQVRGRPSQYRHRVVVGVAVAGLHLDAAPVGRGTRSSQQQRNPPLHGRGAKVL